MENVQLREEVGIYKGRCTNLARDVELHYNEMHKLNNDSNHSSKQLQIMHERVQNLEQDVEVMRQQRNEAQEDTRRLTQQNEILEKELITFRTKSLKAEGDNQSSNATVGRLQGQLNGKDNDIRLLMQAKGELERLLQQAKQEALTAESGRDDVYKQLVSTKENLDIMINEQKILSEELTQKQNEVLKSERDKLQLERELLELRPLKATLKSYTEGQQKTIEEATRNEFEKNKLNQKVRQLETSLQNSKIEVDELTSNYQTLIKEKNILMQQLQLFEKDSYEI